VSRGNSRYAKDTWPYPNEGWRTAGTDRGRVFGIKGTSLFCTLKNIHIPISSIYIITELRDSYEPVSHF
jgi:hypothetical protein